MIVAVGVIMLAVIGLEIQEMSRLKTTTHPKIIHVSITLTIHCTEMIIIKKENCVNSGYSEENLTHKKALNMIRVILEGKIVKPKLIQINLPRWPQKI